jgi:hypothetical protein
MFTHKGAWFFVAISAVSVLSLIATPIALADDGHGKHGDGDDRARPVQVQVQQVRDQDENVERDDDDDANINAANIRLTNLVTAINNDVALLSNLGLNDEDDDDVNVDIDSVRTVNLATLESGLSSTSAATLTNAVNANSAAVQSFLNGGSAQASAIDMALSSVGISPSTVLAVLPLKDGRLIVITA